MSNYKPIPAGTIFGRLTVIQDGRRPKVWCRCVCGGEIWVNLDNLKYGRTRSCGCLRYEVRGVYQTTHGLSHTPEIRVWSTMIQRCSNPRKDDYARYGGRGIRVCERWKQFTAFYEDMGPRPSPEHSIDRVDNTAGYSKDNCRWATRVEQQNNKRSNRLVVLDGVVMSLAQACRMRNLPYSPIQLRLRRGWSTADAFSTPILVQYQRLRRAVTG